MTFQRDMSAPSEERSFEVGRPEHGSRLDLFLCGRLTWASRARIRASILAGSVTIEQHKDAQGAEPTVVRNSTRLRRGQRVVITIEAAHLQDGAEPVVDEAEIPIVYEDEVLIAVSKPPSTSIYPSRRHRAGSLIERLHRRHAAEGCSGGPPSPCHRLDRETSGLVLLAKERAARAEVGRQFEAREVKKIYLAWVRGVVEPDEGRIDLALGPDAASRVELRRAPVAAGEGQAAITYFFVRHRAGDRTLLELRPETGRQHQLRVHVAAVGHPILGDRLYLGGDDLFLDSLGRNLTAEELQSLGAPRLALHSWRLTLQHPTTRQRLDLEAVAWPDLVPYALARTIAPVGDGTPPSGSSVTAQV